MKKDLTIKRLVNTDSPKLYSDFILNESLDSSKIQVILSLAVAFLNSEEKDIYDLGYRIIVVYSNRYQNYEPLYDVAINKGLIPISSFIADNFYKDNDNLNIELNRIYSNQFFFDNMYFSFEQLKMHNFYLDEKSNSVVVVAPTSYGKTDLIIQSIKDSLGNVLIITPTKSLLSQTRGRIIQAKINEEFKIISHPDMISGREKKIIAILTQERLLKLLKDHENIDFDTVVIDEAHILLSNEKRSQILADAIILLHNKKPNTKFKLLTPFLVEPSNLKLKYCNLSFIPFAIKERMKTEFIYYISFMDYEEHKEFLYDQYIDLFLETDKNVSLLNMSEYISQNSSFKNIVYLNKPTDTEKFSNEFIKDANLIDCSDSPIIKKSIKDISEYLHPNYKLIDVLKFGVLYHHGGIIDPIRYYIEDLFANCKEISYIVTTSTLLEGVNIPASRMFVLSNCKGRGYLSRSDFKNLIGRINRFRYIFSSGNKNLLGLESKVYIIKSEYFKENANVKKYIQEKMGVIHKDKDIVKNVMLKSVTVGEKTKKDYDENNNFLVNFDSQHNIQISGKCANTEIGKLCFKNNIREIDILELEDDINNRFNELKKNQQLICNSEMLIKWINYIFIFSSCDDDNIKRFQHIQTRNFYAMFLNWRINNTSFPLMISSFVNYWKSLKPSGKDTLVYVGRWGDTIREGYRALWIDVDKKTDEELINYAILRIKEEQDFVDNTIIKYVEVLNELGFIEDNFYKKIKYCDNNPNFMILIKNGYSSGLANILLKKYLHYLQFDISNETVVISDSILNKMMEDDINGIYISELKRLI